MGSLDRANPIDQLEAALGELAALDPVTLADQQVRDGLLVLLRGVNQLAGAAAAFVGSFDARGLSETDAMRATRTWLISFGRMSQGAATGWLNRARLMRQMPAVAEASREGDASTEHVSKVVGLEKKVGVAAIKEYDQILANLSCASKPSELGEACDRIRAYVDPDGAEPDPEAAFQRRGLSIRRCASMFDVRGQLDPEGAAALMTVLDSLMKPPRADDLRTATQRRADALIELARRNLVAGGLPTVGGQRPQLGILVTPESLLGLRDRSSTEPATRASKTDAQRGDGGHGTDEDDPAQPRGPDALSAVGVPPLPEPPWMDWAGKVPAELARRIACDCDVWRAVLDPATGLPLEVGRNHRIVPHWIRKALHARDRGCRWPGCDSPTSWTDAHHLIAWYLGGETNIDNLLLLCRYHHARVHEGQWRIVLDQGTGEVTVIRPDGRPYELGPSIPWTGPNSRPVGRANGPGGPAQREESGQLDQAA